MRLLFLTNAPHARSSYGQQARVLVQGLRKRGHDAAILAAPHFSGGSTTVAEIPTFGGSRSEPYSQDTVAIRAAEWNADIVVSFMDAWVLRPELYPNVRHVPFFPVDCDQLKPQEKAVLGHQNIWDRVGYAKHAQKVAQDAGFPTKYLPLGVDMSVFRPMDRDDVRKELGFPDDAIIFGVVAANDEQWPGRKSLWELLAAWTQFRKERPTLKALLYIHTTPIGGMNLVDIANQFGVGANGDNSVLFPGINMLDGTPAALVAKMYNAIDWLVMPSRGEGAGLPLIEAQACRCPVIAGEWTGMAEHIYGGIAIPKECAVEEASPGYMSQGCFRWAIHPQALVQVFCAATDMPEEQRAALGEQGQREVEKRHEWSVVLSLWDDVLKEWDRRLLETPQDGRRTGRTDLTGDFTEQIVRAQETQASFVIVCPSFGEKCGIAEYSVSMLWELLRVGIKAVIARSMAEADAIIRACATTPYPVETLLIQHEYSLYDRNSYLSQGEPLASVIDRCVKLRDDIKLGNIPTFKMAFVMHTVNPKPEYTDIHKELTGNFKDCLYTTSLKGSEYLHKLTGSFVNTLRLGSWTVPHWIPMERYEANEVMTIGNFGMLGPQRKIREQIALCKRTSSKFLGSFATNQPNAKESIEAILAEEGVQGQVFTDWATDEEILSRLSSCDVLYMPRNSSCYYSSASVRLASNALRPIIVNKDNGYSDIADYGAILANDLDEAVTVVDSLRLPANYQQALEKLGSWRHLSQIPRVLAQADILGPEVML